MNRPYSSFSRRALVRLGITLAFGAVQATSALAQGYPSKPVQVIVPFPAGGPADVIARALGKQLYASLNQPFIITNQAGAGGNIGGKAAALAQPDGHTLLITLDTTLTANPILYGKRMGYEVKDLRPIATLLSYGQTLVVHPSLNVKTLENFIDLARKQSITYASAGKASPGHLVMEQLADIANIKLTHVPYRGAAPAVTDLMGGHVQAGFLVTPGVAQQALTGKLIPIAVSSTKRSQLLPQVPTVTEAGFAGATLEFSMVVLAPAKTPDAIVQQLNAEIRKAVNSEEMRKHLASSDMLAAVDSPAEAAERIKSTTAKMTDLITKRSIEIE